LLDFALSVVGIDSEDKALDDFPKIDLEDFPDFFDFDDLENDVCSKDNITGVFDDFVEMEVFRGLERPEKLSPPDDSPYEIYGNMKEKGSFITSQKSIQPS